MADVVLKLGPNTWLQGESTGGDCSAGDPAILKTTVSAMAPGTGASSLGKAEDAVAGSGDVGVMALAVRADTPAATAGNGDYHPLLVDSAGRQHTRVGVIEAGETHVGEVGGGGDVVDLTLSLDTSAYADGDVLADTQELAGAVRVSGGRAYLQSIHVLDEDDQGGAFDIVFLNANTSLGTENSAPNISDSNARNIIGRVSVASTDYYDIGGSRIATIRGLGLMLKASGSTSLYVAAISRDAKTYTASGIRLKFGLMWD